MIMTHSDLDSDPEHPSTEDILLRDLENNGSKDIERDLFTSKYYDYFNREAKKYQTGINENIFDGKNIISQIIPVGLKPIDKFKRSLKKFPATTQYVEML